MQHKGAPAGGVVRQGLIVHSWLTGHVVCEGGTPGSRTPVLSRSAEGSEWAVWVGTTRGLVPVFRSNDSIAAKAAYEGRKEERKETQG